MTHQATKKFAGFMFSLLLLIGLGCSVVGGGDDASSEAGADSLPAQPTPDLEEIVEQIVTKLHEDASAEEVQDLVRASVSDALETHETSTDAPQFPSVVVHEDDILSFPKAYSQPS